jgi:hypothetical protein
VGGTITDSGVYTAPTTVGTYHVVATSVADASKSVTAAVSVLTSGFFTPTGNMRSVRTYHTATVLPNGKVLVAGGSSEGTCFCDITTPSNSAELFDLVSGTFDSTGSLGTPREAHTATLLPNGKVLVAGGVNQDNGIFDQATETAELYDPAVGSFTSTGSMGTARTGHTATLLPSGKVLIVGGDTTNSGGLASAELYDPATGFFTPTGSMGTARGQHTATLLPNGKVLIVGGGPGGPIPGSFASAELYDPAVGSFTSTGSMGTARTGHTATLLPSGQVLVAGGDGATAELYDPAAGSFAPTGSMTSPRWGATATLLPNGQVLVAGGNGATAELYE